MDENDQSTTSIPSDHLEVLLKEPLPSPTLDDIETVTDSLKQVQSSNHHDRLHVDEDPVHPEKETEISTNQTRHDQSQISPSIPTCTSDSYFRTPYASTSGSVASTKRVKLSYESSIAVLGIDANTILIVTAALSKCVPVFVYDQKVRFHKDLVGAKFVDTPAILTRYAKIVFVCQTDSTEKIQQCTGK